MKSLLKYLNSKSINSTQKVGMLRYKVKRGFV